MKTAIVLTTINVPKVLTVYARLAKYYEAMFFVIGDRKTPDQDVVRFLEQHKIPHAYYGYDWQAKLGYACHELIGENSIQRRNIGFLEALKWHADQIISIDDDNIPLHEGYLTHHIGNLEEFDACMCVEGRKGWVDVGQYLRPVSPHRGFPIQVKHDIAYDPFCEGKIGVSAGICLGDPDINAATRIVNKPDVQDVSVLLQHGLVVSSKSWTVFNSQNTAIVRELLPAWGMVPFVGRYDDIYASLICQRVMRDRGYHVRFGQPFVAQQRNEHDLIKDLRAELDGMQNVLSLAEALDHIILPGHSVVEDTRLIWNTLEHAEFMPARSVEAMLAYVDDCERVL